MTPTPKADASSPSSAHPDTAPETRQDIERLSILARNLQAAKDRQVAELTKQLNEKRGKVDLRPNENWGGGGGTDGCGGGGDKRKRRRRSNDGW